MDILLVTNPRLLHEESHINKVRCSGLFLQFKVTLHTPVPRHRGKTRKTSDTNITLKETLRTFDPKTESLSLALRGVERNPTDTSGPLIKLVSDTRLKSDRKLEHIQDWVQKEMANFNFRSRRAMRCRREDIQEDELIFPARLLDLSTYGMIKLIDCAPKLAEERVHYVALSHRWGASQHLTLTTQTESQWRGGLSLECLPQTFRDAVFITRQLGFSFLWIDALTIIQDSNEDWRKESVNMGDIFQNAFLTIAAHCAADDSEGFLCTALVQRQAFVHREQGCAIGVHRFSNADVDVTGSGLAKRGWVLQERLLATRTLHFTRGQVYLENFMNILGESGYQEEEPQLQISEQTGTRLIRSAFLSPSDMPQLRRMFGLSSDWGNKRRKPLTKSSHKDGRNSGQITTIEWLKLVEMYSRCDLTKDTDKLIAIAGMARKLHSNTGVAWCAGIWEDYVCEGLLWLRTIDDLHPSSQPRAPSWSWASWDGNVQFPVHISRPIKKRGQRVKNSRTAFSPGAISSHCRQQLENLRRGLILWVC